MVSNSGGKVESLLRTWRMRDAVKLALQDERALEELLSLIDEDDVSVQIRALSALLELVRGANWRLRKKILETGFKHIINALKSDDVRVLWRTLAILSYLLKNNPLNGEKLSKLVRVLLLTAKTHNGLVWDGLLSAVENIRAPCMSDEVAEFLLEKVRNGSYEEAAIASLILLNSGAVERHGWKSVVERVGEIISTGDPELIEAGLHAAMKLTKLPTVFPMDVVMKSLIPSLRRFISTCNDPIRKQTAIEVFDRLRDMVVRYYRVRPREAQRIAEELSRLGLLEEAYLIASNVASVGGLVSLWNDRPT